MIFLRLNILCCFHSAVLLCLGFQTRVGDFLNRRFTCISPQFSSFLLCLIFVSKTCFATVFCKRLQAKKVCQVDRKIWIFRTPMQRGVILQPSSVCSCCFPLFFFTLFVVVFLFFWKHNEIGKGAFPHHQLCCDQLLHAGNCLFFPYRIVLESSEQVDHSAYVGG